MNAAVSLRRAARGTVCGPKRVLILAYRRLVAAGSVLRYGLPPAQAPPRAVVTVAEVRQTIADAARALGWREEIFWEFDEDELRDLQWAGLRGGVVAGAAGLELDLRARAWAAIEAGGWPC